MEDTKALPSNCTCLLATVIKPQHFNDKHDGSGDQNINRVVDMYFKIDVVFLLLASYLIPPFYFWWLLPGGPTISDSCHIVTLSQVNCLIGASGISG